LKRSILVYLHVVEIVCDPDAFVVALLFGSDSQTTLPSVSLRINLYWKLVLGGRLTVIVQIGYVAADRGSDAAGSQVPNCEMLPTRKMFSPNVVVAISDQLTATVDEPVPVPVPLPVPSWPVWIAMALRAGTVAVNAPPETVKPVPVQAPPELFPLITSQYALFGRDVVNVVVHAESALLIATKPAEPRPNAICCDCGETQFVIAADPTWLRKPTMPVIATKRCWQSQPFAPPVAEHVPAPPFGAPSSVVLYE